VSPSSASPSCYSIALRHRVLCWFAFTCIPLLSHRLAWQTRAPTTTLYSLTFPPKHSWPSYIACRGFRVSTSLLYNVKEYLLINRSPTSSLVVVCSLGGFKIATELSVIYQRVHIPVFLIGTDWGGSLIPYEGVNKMPELESKEDLRRHPRYGQGNC
jgi:hypothetical protein